MTTEHPNRALHTKGRKNVQVQPTRSVGSVSSMHARTLLDELRSLSTNFATESNPAARNALAKRARKAAAMAVHPGLGMVPRETVNKAISTELRDAVQALPPARVPSNK